MLLFLILLFPLGFAIWCRSRGVEGLPKYLPVAAMGVFSSAVYCTYKFFFSPFYYLAQDSFILNFMYEFLTFTAIPLLVLTLFFAFFARGDALSVRFENIFPFYAGFYGVYVPFRVLCGTLPFPFFVLFAKPLIYFFMTLAISKILSVFFANGKLAAAYVMKKSFMFVAFFIVLFMPALIEAFWMMGIAELVIAVMTVCYIFVCTLVLLVRK